MGLHFTGKPPYSERSMNLTSTIAPIPMVINKTYIGSADSFFSSIFVPLLSNLVTLLRRKTRLRAVIYFCVQGPALRPWVNMRWVSLEAR